MGWVFSERSERRGERRRDGCRSAVAIVACVLAGALLTAGPASAASRRWTVRNESTRVLQLESVTPWRENAMAFEGRAHDGSFLISQREDHFELKYGADYQAVLEYKDVRSGVSVEYWIRNALDFADSRCRFLRGSKEEGGWHVEDHYDPTGSNLRLFCMALPFSRTVYFTDSIGLPPPPSR
jgi:hypothetical protein